MPNRVREFRCIHQPRLAWAKKAWWHYSILCAKLVRTHEPQHDHPAINIYIYISINNHEMVPGQATRCWLSCKSLAHLFSLSPLNVWENHQNEKNGSTQWPSGKWCFEASSILQTVWVSRVMVKTNCTCDLYITVPKFFPIGMYGKRRK